MRAPLTLSDHGAICCGVYAVGAFVVILTCLCNVAEAR